jgi:cyclic pyranopterin phosphate synthase
MLIDGHNRKVNYLRVSVTERCNFRCQYCMPEKPFSWVPKENILSFEDMFKFVKLSIDNGVNKIRITGGEPLLREDLDSFIGMIYNYNKDIDLALTTNGYLLKQQASKLKKAGLKRVNISLDSLKKDVAKYIAQKDVLDDVIFGIEESLRVGLKVKINMVPLKGVNDNEVLPLLKFCKERNIPIRFIEYMENSFAVNQLKKVSAVEVLEIIAKEFQFIKVKKDDSSPAQYYKLKDGYQFGIIEPSNHDFCSTCNRLRLTAEGDLIPCLYFDEALSIAESVKKGDIVGASKVLGKVLRDKPKENRWMDESVDSSEDISQRAFYETGG